MITAPLKWFSLDLEYVECNNGNRTTRSPCEIAIYDIVSGTIVFSSLIRPADDFSLTDWRIQRGYSNEALTQAPTIEQVDRLLRHLLQGAVVVFWNMQFDLDHWPSIQTYSYQVRDAMVRYSNKYGSWSPTFGDYKWMKLADAAAQLGIFPKSGQFFHSAEYDAVVCGRIWKFCDQQDLPGSWIHNDLVRRTSAEKNVSSTLSLIGDHDPSLKNKSEDVDDSKIDLSVEKKDDKPLF
tara:strand:- start:496 stop:1206 length:711 start_codon:yes stop_codon:yes gene_type:complete